MSQDPKAEPQTTVEAEDAAARFRRALRCLAEAIAGAIMAEIEEQLEQEKSAEEERTE